MFDALIEKVRAKLGIDSLLTRVSGVETHIENQDEVITKLLNTKSDKVQMLNLLEKLTEACEKQIAETEARLNKRIDQVLEDEQHRVHEMLVEGLSKV